MRSGRTACATHGGSASTARPGASGSAMSARRAGRRSAPPALVAGPVAQTSAGAASRAIAPIPGTLPGPVGEATTSFRRSCTATDPVAPVRSPAATWCGTPRSGRSPAGTSMVTTAPAPCTRSGGEPKGACWRIARSASSSPASPPSARPISAIYTSLRGKGRSTVCVPIRRDSATNERARFRRAPSPCRAARVCTTRPSGSRRPATATSRP